MLHLPSAGRDFRYGVGCLAGPARTSCSSAISCRPSKETNDIEGTVNYEEQNDRYVVIGEYPCHGCGENVSVRRKGEKRAHLIATGLGTL